MRTQVLLASSIIALLLGATTAFAQEPTTEPAAASNFSVTWTVSAVEGRLFKDQGFVLNDDLTILNDLTACTEGGTCFGVWNAWSPTGNTAAEETDVSVSHDFVRGDTTVTPQAMYIFVEGPDVWDVNVTIDHRLNDNWSAGVSAEVMRGGFNDTVAQVYLTGSTSSGPWSASVTPSIAYSDWSGRTGFGISASAGYTFGNGVKLEVIYDGYVGEDSNGFFGVQLVKGLF